MYKKEKIIILLLSLATLVIAGVLLLNRANRKEKNENNAQASFFHRVQKKAGILRTYTIQMLQDEGLQGQELAVVSAMAFGEKRLLTPDIRQAYSKSGAAHLLALSGTHLAILFFMLSVIFGGRWSGVVGKVLTLATIWLYAVFAGLPASLIRSATMLTIITVATIDGHRRAGVRTLLFTALVMFVVSPTVIYDRGFHLSFLAVLGIFIFLPCIYNLIPGKILFEYSLLRWLWSMFAVSISAQIFTAPLVYLYFDTFSPWFLITNLVAIPLVTILLYTVCTTLLLWWCIPIRILLVKLIALIVSALNYLIMWISL